LPANSRTLFAQHHVVTGECGAARRLEACETATDHEHLARLVLAVAFDVDADRFALHARIHDAAHLAGMPTLWIAVGVIVLIGIGILTGTSRTKTKDPPTTG